MSTTINTAPVQGQLSFGQMSLAQKALTSAKWLGHQIARAWVYIFTFRWAEGLLSWLILSAGTLSGCIFFLSGLWFMVDASVHPFVEAIVSGKLIELFKSGHTDIVLSWLATTAFTGLPEFLLPLATYTVFKHFKTWRYTKQNEPLIWFWLFVIPAVLFLIVTVVTLGFSIASDGMTNLDLTNLNVEALAKSQFTLPMWIVVPRGIVAFFYGFFSLIYPHIGKPSEVDRLREKDNTISQLRQEIIDKLAELRQEKDAIIAQLRQEKDAIQQSLNAEIARIQHELDTAYREKDAAIQEKSLLYTALTQSSEDALQAYGDDVIAWFNSLDKTVEIDDIVAHTGISKKRLQNAIGHDLRVRGTNQNRIWVPSLKDYLIKNAPKTEPALHVVNG